MLRLKWIAHYRNTNLRIGWSKYQNEYRYQPPITNGIKVGHSRLFYRQFQTNGIRYYYIMDRVSQNRIQCIQICIGIDQYLKPWLGGSKLNKGLCEALGSVVACL